MYVENLLKLSYRLKFNFVIQKQPQYEYTLPNSVLTDEQRDFYEKNGFIVIPNLVSAEALEKYRYVDDDDDQI